MRPDIRKIEPVESHDFDQQLWPVNLALLVLCGCVVGMTLALGDFHTHNWLQNAYVQLVVGLGTVLVLTRVAMRIGGRAGGGYKWRRC